MKKISKNQIAKIGGGNGTTFCKTVYVIDGVYVIGTLVNLWNPVGWGGVVAGLAVNGYCAFF